MSETGTDRLEVTSSAIEQLEDYFKGRDKNPIRIFLNEGG